jgi:hypothetical protein
VTDNFSDFQLPDENGRDEFFWDRFIKALVLNGFGDYETAANADLVDAAVFLFLSRDIRSVNRNWILHGDPPFKH